MEISWEYLLWAAALFLASFVLSLIVVGAVLIQLPSTYFLNRSARRLWVDQHPAVRVLLHLTKNLLGLGLVGLGILLSVPGIPGQGLLTVLIGLMLLDFPGKRRWERRIVSRPRIFRAINRLRRRFGKPPLRLAEDRERCRAGEPQEAGPLPSDRP